MTDAGPGDLPTGGSARPIVRWGEPVMHRACAKVTDFEDDLAALVADMAATMYAADGVGLAAPQLGVGLSVFVFDCPDADHRPHRGVVCNPVLEPPEGADRRLVEDDEGCLSLPGAFIACPRPDWARVTGVDHRGREVAYEGDGLLARCLQHESDHLDGIVFGDRLSYRRRKTLLKEAERLSADFPPDWPAG